MIESLGLFAWAIVVGSFLAVTLSLYGVHLATRDSALQSMAISQGAQLGVLLTLGLFHADQKFLPWLGGLFIAFLVSLLSDRIARNVRASKNTIFIVFFLTLLAASYCLISIFPMLDSHHSQAFFGDLVYLAGTELMMASVVSVVCFTLMIANFKTWCNRSFLLATFSSDSLIKPKDDRLFFVSGLVLIVTSVFSVGLMLTLAALFIPSMVLSFVKRAHLVRHFLSCAMVSGFGVVFGFVATIQLGDYPTVPVVVLAFLLLSLLFLMVFNFRIGRQTD